MCRFSIIVPVYKVEPILPRCIESILNQTVADFELILIDDGSPDRCGLICDEYAAKDSRIHVIHQVNGGVSRARNAGMDIAKGEYIVFVDSDDWVDKGYLSILNRDDADVAVVCSSVYLADGTLKETTYEENLVTSITSEADIICFLKKWYAIQVWGKRFRRKVIEENSLRFDTSFQYGEDSLFLAQYIMHTQRIVTYSDAVYNIHRFKEDSLTELANQNWFDNYSVLQERLYYLFSEYPKVQQYLASKYIWVIEREIIQICQDVAKGKMRRIKAILDNPHTSKCIKVCKHDMSCVSRIIVKLRLPLLVYLRYKKW